jgi:site-specific DNA-methyltransferase (adenine-specific)
MKQLFFGDNLEVLKEIGEESVDLVYLDPPFNSKANYNIFFDNTQKVRSETQIQAFEDTWHWGTQSENEYDELLISNNSQVIEIVTSLRNFLGESDVMAYLIMMTSRLLAMHRVIKDTGSLYLHCDATASHYLKIILDGIFEVNNFRNEIIWKRTTAHSDSKTFGINTDRILFYTKSNKFIFNQTFLPYEESYKRDLIDMTLMEENGQMVI